VVARSATEREGVAVDDSQVLPFSTGVIGQRLPVATIVAGIPAAFAALVEDDWIAAARGIMTTDTRPKAVSRRVAFSSGETVTITGIAKGAGMLKPNMATMLAFVFTDARVEAQSLQVMLNQITNESFNRITVDGDTSTNDACLLVATGVSGVEISPNRQPDHDDFVSNLRAVFLTLATELIRDAEGATKFVTVIVEGGASSDECLAVAYAIAESPLVKTALFASDPNWGRILAAIGRAGLKELNIDRLTIDLGETRLVENGGLAASYTEEAGQTEMDREEITVTVNLARGTSKEIVWTSDLSQDYVRINADYRS
jgi:glutamate N-acetyltransferase/amino-acid N-acetyltransferase